MRKYNFTAGNARGAGAAKPQPPEAHGITAENLLGGLPPVLAGAPTLYALARAAAGVLAQRQEEIERVSIYPHIGRLEGPLLDILAQDFKVDWWDPDLTLEEKRRTLQASWQVHRTLGTKASVEKAASAVYPDTKVQEWFEYGGQPYHFRLDVGLPEGVWDPERKRRLMWGLYYYKNLRSHLDAVEFHLPPAVLENRQSFLFAALMAYMGRTRNHRRLALAGQRYGAREGNPQGFALAGASLGAAAGWRQQTASAITVRARAGCWGQAQVRLDGSRRLDGGWTLDQRLKKGVALERAKFHAGARGPQGAAAFLSILEAGRDVELERGEL